MSETKKIVEECITLSVADMDRLLEKIEKTEDIKINPEKIARYLKSMRTVLELCKDYLSGLEIKVYVDAKQEEH